MKTGQPNSFSIRRIFSAENLETAGFYACLGLILLCVWYYPYLTSTDGPDHVANAALIVDLLTGRCPAAKDFFQFNTPFLPNWSGHAVMATAIFLGASLQHAEKIVFSLCILLPAIGFRRIASLYKKNDPRSWIGAALGLNQTITNSGLYNYTLGLGIFLIAVAYYLNQGKAEHKKRFLVIFALLLTGAWFSHILAFLFIGAFVFIHEANVFIRHAAKDRFSALLPQFKAWLQTKWPLWGAFIPALILSVLYLQQPFKNFDMVSGSPEAIWHHLATILFMKNFYQVQADDPNLMVFYGLIGIPALLLALKNTVLKRADIVTVSLVATAFMLWIIPFVSPASIQGGWMIMPRFLMAGWYLMFAAALRSPWKKTGAQLFTIYAIALLVGNVQAYAIKRANMQVFADRILAQAPVFKDNAVIYTLEMMGLTVPGSKEVPIFAPDVDLALLPVGNILADKAHCVINLNNYEAIHDYFPLRFKISRPPGPAWGFPYLNPTDNKYYNSFLEIAQFDPLAYLKETHLPLDYIVIEGDPEMLLRSTDPAYTVQQNYLQKSSPVFEQRLDEIGAFYSKIYQVRDKDGSWIRLYKNKGN